MLAAFRGAARRFELRGEAAGVEVVRRLRPPPRGDRGDARERARSRRRRVCSCSSSRISFRERDISRRELARALAAADVVAVTDIYPAREQPIAGVTRQARGRRARGAAPGDAGRRGRRRSTRAARFLAGRARRGRPSWSRSERATSTALRRSCWRRCDEDRGGSPALAPHDARHRRGGAGVRAARDDRRAPGGAAAWA